MAMWILNKNKRIKAAKHTVIGLTVFVVYLLFFSYNHSNYSYSISISAIISLLTLGIAYTLTQYLFPRFLYQSKYIMFSLYTFYLMVFASYFIVITIYAFLFFMFDFHMKSFPPMSKNFSSIFLLVLTITGILCFFEVLRKNHQTTLDNRQLSLAITETQLELKTRELTHLKAQLNPHFLFNTLNTLYGLSIKQSALTPDAILKLSNLLNYSLYQTNKTKVLLKEEMEHIYGYLEMEKLRFRDQLMIKKDICTIPDSLSIPPMLLITFIENAFKHGRAADGMLRISIRLKLNNAGLLFMVANSTPSQSIKKQSGGLGLASMDKCLQITYPNQYTLRTICTSKAYFAALQIENLNL